MILIIFIAIYLTYDFSIFKRITRKSMYFVSAFIFAFVYYQIDNNDFVTFVNVGQADCALIKTNGANYLIDAGVKMGQEDKLKTIGPYLKYERATRIEKAFISHNDSDHNGAIADIDKEFNVKEVVRKTNWTEYKSKNITMLQLNQWEWDNENDNSQVILMFYKKYKILFTGDISTQVEQKIASQWKWGSIDVLKVGHHGSKTSTSSYFIETIKPKNAVISVGNNNFGHPNQQVITTLKDNNVNVYNTLENGAVKFNFRNGKITYSNML